MDYPTYASIKQRAQERIDIQEETFISPNELLRYCQDAIDFCENKIHTFQVADRYFETVAPLALVSGVMDYQLPSNIYANKITKIMYERGTDIYEIRRLTNKDRYGDMALYTQYSHSDLLKYMIFNNSHSVKPVMRVFPRPSITVATYTPTLDTNIGSPTVTVSSATGLVRGQFVSSANIPSGTRIEVITGTSVLLSAAATATNTGTASTITQPDVMLYYIRNVNKPLSDTDVIEIPEFSSYIIQYMVVECLKKDVGNPRLQTEQAKLAELQQDMEGTLANMTPDQHDEIEIDNTIYTEST